MRVIVLGIDPGTATTGFGLVTVANGRLTALDYGVIRTAPEDPPAARLRRIFQGVGDLIRSASPDCVAVEQLFFNKNVRSALAVGQARGVVLLAASMGGLSVAEYTPLQVKQAVVGYGRAEKQQIQHMVKVLLGLEDIPRPDDAADALAIAICHSHSSQSLHRLQSGGKIR